MYFVKTPKIIQAVFKEYLWRIDTDKKEIYLTFDDGPTPKVTHFVLKTLKKYHAKATFFCIGKNIENHPQIFEQIINDGHSIGNHTQNHLNGWKTETTKYIENIEKGQDSINKKIQKTSQQNKLLFRPAYGKIKNLQAKILIKKGYKIIMWTILSGDFDIKIDKDKCHDNVINSSKKGAIIVFHDSEKAFKTLSYVLPKVLAYFSKKGFTFKKL